MNVREKSQHSTSKLWSVAFLNSVMLLIIAENELLRIRLFQ